MRLVIFAVLLLGAVVVVLAWRRGRLWTAALLVVVAFAAAWGLALAAMWTDYRDADGWVDCWPSCTALQHGVGTVLVLGPVAAVAVLLLALGLATVTRLRERASRRRG
jgi:hypothetical protein